MRGNFRVPKTRSQGSCLAESNGGVQGCLVNMQVEGKKIGLNIQVTGRGRVKSSGDKKES